MRRLYLLIILMVASVPSLAENPTSPVNLRASVYSKTAAKVFWERSTDDGVVRGYEVVRDGDIIGEFDALSYFDADVSASVAHVYSVTGNENDGNRSQSSTITLPESVSLRR